MENSNIRFAYFKAQTNSGNGIVCAALQRPPKGSTSTKYRAGFSFYSPNETKSFSKDRARQMAMGRLLNWRTNENSKKFRLEFDFSVEPGEKFNLQDVFSFCMITMMSNAPHWVSRAFDNDQLFVGLTEEEERQIIL